MARVDARRTALQHEGLVHLVAALQVDGVLVGTAHHIGRACDRRLQGLGAAREIHDLDGHAFRAEVAELVGDRQRQRVERRLAAHGDGEFALLDTGLRTQRGRSDSRCRQDHAGGEPSSMEERGGHGPS
jgi:hypothetical protein